MINRWELPAWVICKFSRGDVLPLSVDGSVFLVLFFSAL